ncbi:MAG: hypothetical protein GY778_14585, partial [bacterium]|nr:hypothetical protein [bacterium]
STQWSVVAIPPGSDAFVSFLSPSSLTSSYVIDLAVPGDYVFRLTWVDQKISDTVTLTLQTGP